MGRKVEDLAIRQGSHSAPRANWAGNVQFGATRIHEPDSIDALRHIVEDSTRIRALGQGHSFSRIADTPGAFVLLRRLPQTLEIDSVNLTANVTAGATYAELAQGLHRAGFALANMASLPDISIAGACATGTHGSGDDQRVLAASVAAMQVVVADGSLLEFRRNIDRDRFPGSVVSLGSLGIVTQLTLDIQPEYEMSQLMHPGVPLQVLEDQLDDVFGAGHSVSAFTDWKSDEANVLVKHRAAHTASGWTGGSPADHAVHPVPGRSPELCTEQMGLVGPWYERLPHFRARSSVDVGDELQSEIFIPRTAARRAIGILREISSLIAPALLISELRTIGSDDLWLSPAYGRASIGLHFTWTTDASAVLPAITAVEERLSPLDPRPHWAKLTTMHPHQIISSYERAPDFERMMVEHDPTFKFRNDFVDDLFPA